MNLILKNFGVNTPTILIITSILLLLNGLVQTAIEDDKVCYGEFGCFEKSELSKEWKLPNILAGQFPEPPEKQNVHFHLFSCEDRYNPSILTWNSPERAYQKLNFDPKKRSLIMIHGYTDYYEQFNWMGDAKDFILRKNPCTLNVITVDWSGGSKVPNYLQGAANTRLVGAVVAKFVQKMNHAYNLTNDGWIIMGHSLGGQTSGFAGKLLRNPKLHLIIGLDPAGPAFSDVSLKNRLNPDDARLVVSLQTNGGINVADGYGILAPSGHYTFYPNGGENQPGCDPVHSVTSILMNGLFEGVSDTVACSHRRAYFLAAYDESMYDEFESLAYRCNNYTEFSAGRCGTCRDGTTECVPWLRFYDYWIDQDVPKDWTRPLTYYIDTRAQAPYSYFHYQIKVITGSDFKEFAGRLFLNITGSLRNDFSEHIEMEEVFEPNTEYTYLHKSMKSIGKILVLNATITGVSTSKTITSVIRDILPGNRKKSDFITIREIQINYMNGYLENQRRSLSAVLRARESQNGQVVINRDTYTEFRAEKPLSRPNSPSRDKPKQDRNRIMEDNDHQNRPDQNRNQNQNNNQNNNNNNNRDRPNQEERPREENPNRNRGGREENADL